MSAIRLLTLAEVPTQGVRECRAGAPWFAVWLVLAISGLCLWIGIPGGIPFGDYGGIPAVLAWWVGVVMGLYGLMLLRVYWKAQHATAWLARVSSDGIYLKWRSFHNRAWGEDGLQVAFIAFGDITQAGRHTLSWNTPEDQASGWRGVFHTLLELDLPGVDLSELQRHLANERAGKPGGTLVTKGIWRHFPVSVEPGNVVRVEWSAKPGLSTVLRWLGERGVKVATPERTQVDLTESASDAQLLEVARQGDLFTMVRVLRTSRGMGLGDAHAMAKKMIAQAGKQKP